MGKLTDMQVGRVDGVDKPAIRKRWVLVKSEDAETVEKDYAGAARDAIEAIAKEGLSFSEETVEVLRALVEMLELDVEFAAKSEEDEAEGESDESAEGEESDEADESAEGDESEEAEATEKASYTADEVEEVVAKALRAAGIDPEKLTGEPVAKGEDVKPLRVTKSRQPQEQDTETRERGKVRKGEGLFANIVLGKPTEPYKR
jgi:cobalamin biosynthesis protein CobT